MIQFDDENIILCVNCDAEYSVTRYDDEEEEPEFCPFCGYHLVEDEDDFDQDEDEEDF